MRRLLCYLIGHDYYIIKELVRSFRKVGCRRCKKEWLMGDHTRSLVEWDNTFEIKDQIPIL